MKGFGDNVPERVWDRSLPPPVGSELSAASGGNSEAEIGILKERLRDY